MNNEELLSGIDALICWECAETRPVFAHDTCQKMQKAFEELTNLLEASE
jgi:hypothetical protein